jgi:hypothetical protein
MTYLRRLISVELSAQAALAACAILMASIVIVTFVFPGGRPTGGLGSLYSAAGMRDVAKGFAFISLAVYFYSALAVTLVIAPIYALIEARGKDNALTSVIAGMLPGFVLLAYRATPFATFDGGGVYMEVACMATGASVALGIYLARTWSRTTPV